MRYNRLGNTGLFVSELCLGTMTFGGSERFAAIGAVAQNEADELVAASLDAGVNFIDTADTYSEGLAERITGQALRNLEVPRDEVIVATKVFGVMGRKPNQRGSSRAHILDACRASLQRLQLDHIDLYQLHGFDPATPIEESLSALTDLVRMGLVRYIGVSNWAAWQIVKALGISAREHLARFASVQAFYAVAARDLEREVLPMSISEGLGVLPWSPLAGGLLSGKVRRDRAAEPGTRQALFKLPFPIVDIERAHDVVDVLAPMAEKRDASVARLAIAWLTQQRGVTSVILGAKRKDQLIDTLRAVEVTFTPDELAAIDAASKIPPEYPGWMIDFFSGERAKQLSDAR